MACIKEKWQPEVIFYFEKMLVFYVMQYMNQIYQFCNWRLELTLIFAFDYILYQLFGL